MIVKKISFILVLSMIFTFAGCSGSTDSSSDEAVYYLNGTVKDASGNPVENAIVQLKFEMDTLKSRPSTAISFAVPSNQSVKLWVTRKLDGSLVRNLIDTVLLAGVHSVGWDFKNQSGKFVRNDMYLLNLKLQTQNQATSLCFINNNVTSQTYSDLDFFAKTDASGNYRIDIRQIPVGVRFDIITQTQDTTEQAVSAKMNIWAIHPDNRRSVVQSVNLNSNRDTKANIVF